MKSKKWLNTLVIAFVMIFGVGAAFAFAPGQVDIAGTINLAAPDDLYVSWVSIDEGPNFTPASGTLHSNHTTVITDYRGRTDQRIVWTINFDEPGFAAITATARNNSARPAIITGGNLNWTSVYGSGSTPATFGLSYYILSSAFEGILAPGATTSMTVRVEWDGRVPESFIDSATGEYSFAASFEITFDYAPA